MENSPLQKTQVAGLKRNLNTSAIMLVWNVLAVGVFLVSGQYVNNAADNAEGLGGFIIAGSLGGIALVIAMVMIASCFVGILMGFKRAIVKRHHKAELVLNLMLTGVSIGGFIAYYSYYLYR